MTGEHIEISIAKALKGESNLTQEILNIRGFSTPTIRHLFNNICDIDGANYLEIGLFCGATFCSSFNKGTVSIGIENFSQDFSVGFDKTRHELETNFKTFSNIAKDSHIFYVDCFEGKLKYPFGFDIYFYDAHHEENFQAKALPYFIDSMAEVFLFIVDDTNWESVTNGTKKGFDVLKDKIEIEKSWQLKGERTQDDPIWHNGINLYLIKKK